MKKVYSIVVFLVVLSFSCNDESSAPNPVTEISLTEFQTLQSVFNSGLSESFGYMKAVVNTTSSITETDFINEMEGHVETEISSKPFYQNVYTSLSFNLYPNIGARTGNTDLFQNQQKLVNDITSFLENNFDFQSFESAVNKYLEDIEVSDHSSEDKYFAYTIGLLAIESGRFWIENGENIITEFGSARINGGWDWGEFAGAVVGGAVTGALGGAAVGGTATLGTLAVPAAVAGGVAGGLLGGIGYGVAKAVEALF